MRSKLMDLSAWELFLEVLERQSIARVAELHGMDRSQLSRRIAELEEALGTPLLVRSGRSIMPTQAALEAGKLMRPVLESAAAALGRLNSADAAETGSIRFGAMPGFMQEQVVPLLVDFQAIYPHITFDVISDDNPQQFMKGQTDLMLYYGPVHNAALVEHFVTRSAFIACASPRYLEQRGRPHTPLDLAAHAGIVYSGRVRPHSDVLELGGSRARYRFQSVIRFNNILAVKSAVVSGGGIALDIPLHHCYRELIEGKLVPVLDGWHVPNLDNYIAATKEASRLRRVGLFVDWYIRRRREIEGEQRRHVQEEFGVVI